MVTYDILLNTLFFFLGILSYLFDAPIVLYVFILLIFITNLIHGIRNAETSMLFIVFNITFFVFLLSRELTGLIFEKSLYFTFSDEITKKILLLLLASLYFLMIGHHLGNKKRFRIGNIGKNSATYFYGKKDISNRINILKVRRVSLILMYVGAIATIAINIEKTLFLGTTSYVDSYISYKSNLPYIVLKFADIYLIAFFSFLATLPSKRECKIPIYLYIIIGIISLGTGQRNQFVIHILMVIVYLYYRQNIDKDEKWKPRHMVLYVVILSPIIILFLYFWGFYRNGISISGLSFKDVIQDFFVTQGKSVDLIGYSMTYSDVIPDNRWYSFGDVLDFLQNNVISQNLFGLEKYKQNTAEYAMNMHSFGQLITYLVAPSKYLSGGGLGSNYIAEAFVDFGIAGVIIWNTVYGWILGTLTRIRDTSWIKLTLLFFMVSKILYAPRSSTSSFIASTFSLINILVLVFIVFISKSKK